MRLENMDSSLRLASVLGISSQALSWHTKRLRKMGAVAVEVSSQGERLYALPDELRQVIRACAVTSGWEMPEILQTQTAR